jgi:hypothetical protein
MSIGLKFVCLKKNKPARVKVILLYPTQSGKARGPFPDEENQRVSG